MLPKPGNCALAGPKFPLFDVFRCGNATFFRTVRRCSVTGHCRAESRFRVVAFFTAGKSAIVTFVPLGDSLLPWCLAVPDVFRRGNSSLPWGLAVPDVFSLRECNVFLDGSAVFRNRTLPRRIPFPRRRIFYGREICNFGNFCTLGGFVASLGLCRSPKFFVAGIRRFPGADVCRNFRKSSLFSAACAVRALFPRASAGFFRQIPFLSRRLRYGVFIH